MSKPITRIDPIGESLYRISTAFPPELMPGGFSFNQYLLLDEAPLLFHTGQRALFESVCTAIESVLPVEKLRYIAFCHVEADECGALNQFLASAPQAVPVCSQIAAMTNVADMANRPPRALADGEALSLGKHRVKWIDAPHVPHAWENGFLFEESTRTLFCGDLFTQGGADHEPTSDGVLEASEAMRSIMDYYAHGANTRQVLENLASLEPRILACMHGSAYQGDGGTLLRKLADKLDAD